jgi:hypothetical protein
MRCEICRLLQRLNLTRSKDARTLFVCTCKQQRRSKSASAPLLAKTT